MSYDPAVATHMAAIAEVLWKTEQFARTDVPPDTRELIRKAAANLRDALRVAASAPMDQPYVIIEGRDGPAAIVCLNDGCGAVSYNYNDAVHHYCARCRVFH